jgi:hypothetical protein
LDGANLFGEGEQGVRQFLELDGGFGYNRFRKGFLKLWHREQSGGLGNREEDLRGLGLGDSRSNRFRLGCGDWNIRDVLGGGEK